MKKGCLLIVIVVSALLVASPPATAQLAIVEAVKAASKKVIKAVDLKIQRLQNQTIWLQNAQKVLENTLSKLKLSEISDWVERQRTLYADYFDELWKVKTIISYYHRIREIIDKQVHLVQRYQQAFALFRQDTHFTAGEIEHMGKVYNGILDESVKNLDQVFLVINSFSTQMSDAKRLEIIDAASDQIEENYNDLEAFNNSNQLLSLQRSKDAQEIAVVKALYGLP
jgi:hypothetical protein